MYVHQYCGPDVSFIYLFIIYIVKKCDTRIFRILYSCFFDLLCVDALYSYLRYASPIHASSCQTIFQ